MLLSRNGGGVVYDAMADGEAANAIVDGIGRRRRDDMVQLEGVERLRVASHRSRLVISLDGEVVSAEPPLDYKIRKKALRVVAP